MRSIAVAVAIVVSSLAPAGAQDTDKVPKDSVKIVATGCVKNKMLEAFDVEGEDLPDIRTQTFRLSAKKDLEAEVKRQNGRQTEVTGFVRKIDLQEPGLRLGGGRIVIGPAGSADPSRPGAPQTSRRIILLQVISLRPLEGPCTFK
ncbi:MAG TPA: hypothetical protein VK886_22435 [Vicinamibacterales bacterium]|nr:hypothetical protein [Vicinamibacterales bacterium]